MSFWKRIARQSHIYARTFTGNGSRFIKQEWFTAGNYLRLFAAVLIRGVVSDRDDPEFFRGVRRDKYEQTGAETVVANRRWSTARQWLCGGLVD